MCVTVRAQPANPPPHPPLVPQHKKGNHLSPALQPSKTKTSELRVAAPRLPRPGGWEGLPKKKSCPATFKDEGLRVARGCPPAAWEGLQKKLTPACSLEARRPPSSPWLPWAAWL